MKTSLFVLVLLAAGGCASSDSDNNSNSSKPKDAGEDAGQDLGIDAMEPDTDPPSDQALDQAPFDMAIFDQALPPDQAVFDQAPPDQTPDTTSTVSPFAGLIVVTEFIADPDAVSDNAGEWIEVHNTSTADVDLQGWTLKDDGGDMHVINASVVVAAGAYVILAREQDSGTNGGVTPSYVYADVFLANSSDEIVLLDANNGLVDRVVYTDGTITRGASRQLKDPALDNADQANWCTAATAWSGSAGDDGTPGAANDCDDLPDAGPDSSIDASPDIGPDASSDVGSDTSVDTGTDGDTGVE